MKINLERNWQGKWQADAVLDDGRDIHAVGVQPWDALHELAEYWERHAPKPKSDIETLFQIVAEARK
jgi:hypothetical protein